MVRIRAMSCVCIYPMYIYAHVYKNELNRLCMHEDIVSGRNPATNLISHNQVTKKKQIFNII